MLILHSYTPALASAPDELRPWHCGLLYDEDDRGARAAQPLLEADGLIVGDQLPYSGKLYNAAIERHVESEGRPYLYIEIRQDLIQDQAGSGANGPSDCSASAVRLPWRFPESSSVITGFLPCPWKPAAKGVFTLQEERAVRFNWVDN